MTFILHVSNAAVSRFLRCLLSLLVVRRSGFLSAGFNACFRCLWGEQLPNLNPVGVREAFKRGEPEITFSARFDGLVILVRNARALGELLLR